MLKRRQSLPPQVVAYLRSHLDVRRISGPSQVALAPTDVIAVALVQNGEAHVESFLEHHFALGVRHVVLLDNGSVDRTVPLAQQFDRVTVLQSFLPYKEYKYVLKRYLFDRFAGNGWYLVVDIDERFNFPMSNQISLADFVSYLNQEGYTAVVTQMLDLFSDGPVGTWPSGGEALAERCKWYDNSALARRPYQPLWGNRISNAAIRLHEGGIRKSVFGTDVNLSKHPLLFSPGGARPSFHSSHDCYNARIADVTCVLFHYKFDSDFRGKCILAARRENYFQASQEYKAYLGLLEQEPELTLKRDTAEELTSLDQLAENEFLVVSEAYRQFVRKTGTHGP